MRVGDPNQAIYETFTTASPKYLRDFMAEPGATARELPNSGRSTASIMALANALVDWSRRDHPAPALRDALAPTHILPTPEGDPQPNPEDDPDGVRLPRHRLTPGEELELVIESVARWLPEHPDRTVAVLVPRNDRGEAVVNALKARRIECVELLRSTRATRETAGALGNILAAWPIRPRRTASPPATQSGAAPTARIPRPRRGLTSSPRRCAAAGPWRNSCGRGPIPTRWPPSSCPRWTISSSSNCARSAT